MDGLIIVSSLLGLDAIATELIVWS